MLLKQAGITLPLYNQYIEKVSQDIPAMNVNGYMDMNGKWHNYGDSESKPFHHFCITMKFCSMVTTVTVIKQQ